MYAVLDSDDDSPDIVKVAAMYLAQCNFYAAHTHLFMMQQQRRQKLLSVFGLHAYDAITDTLSHAPSLFVVCECKSASDILRLLWQCTVLSPSRSKVVDIYFVHCSFYCCSKSLFLLGRYRHIILKCNDYIVSKINVQHSDVSFHWQSQINST